MWEMENQGNQHLMSVVAMGALHVCGTLTMTEAENMMIGKENYNQWLLKYRKKIIDNHYLHFMKSKYLIKQMAPKKKKEVVEST